MGTPSHGRGRKPTDLGIANFPIGTFHFQTVPGDREIGAPRQEVAGLTPWALKATRDPYRRPHRDAAAVTDALRCPPQKVHPELTHRLSSLNTDALPFPHVVSRSTANRPATGIGEHAVFKRSAWNGRT